jgi:hypothetical protein
MGIPTGWVAEIRGTSDMGGVRIRFSVGENSWSGPKQAGMTPAGGLGGPVTDFWVDQDDTRGGLQEVGNVKERRGEQWLA